MRARRQGSALASSLLYSILGLAIALVAAGAGFLHLNFSNTNDNRQQARNLAESVLARGIACILNSEDYGKSRAPAFTVLLQGGDLPPRVWGALTFDPGTASSRGIPCSTNNLGNPDPVSFQGRSIPGQVAHLTAEAVWGGQHQTVECFLHVPPYPDALAASGEIRSSGLFVAAVTEAGQFTGNLDTIPEAARRPGNIMSNSGASDAVVLGPGCDVRGSVQAVGGVRLSPGVRVQGDVRQGLDPEPIPAFPVDDFVANFSAVYSRMVLPPGSTGDITVDWLTVVDGDLTVNGDCTLDSGILCVSGDLWVQGKFVGQGTVVSSGSVRVDQAGSLVGEDLVALLASGDVRLEGIGPSNSFFKGLIYTEGNLRGRNVTVVGSVVANGGPGAGQLQLDNVGIIQAPVAAQTAHGRPCDLGTWPYARPEFDDDTIAVLARYDESTGRYSVVAKGHDNAAEWPDPHDLGGAEGLTFQEAVDWCAEKYESFQGAGQGRRDDALARQVMQGYLDELRQPQVRSLHLDLRLNRVLDPAENARIVMWRSVP
ncbi:MAG: hypothetical protein AB1758_14140 [Candidatus Eremiobacterota bacterium]